MTGAADPALVAETARIACEQALVDYRAAKLKAVERLGLSLRRTTLPDNARVCSAVVEYQRLYGGAAYHQRLERMRKVAVRAMRLLEDFDPRLVGPVVSGAVTRSHRVQLHAFAEAAERVDVFLHDRGIASQPADRDYRYANGSVGSVPITRFDAGDIGIDVAVFDPGQRSRPPLSPTDGRPQRGLAVAGVEALLVGGKSALTT